MRGWIPQLRSLISGMSSNGMSPLQPSAKLNSIPSSSRLATIIIRLAFFTSTVSAIS